MDAKLKLSAVRRARILEGQMKGITKAIQDEKYCVDILVQSLAIQRSLKSLNRLVLENHLRTHVKEQLRDPKKEGKAIAELLEILTLSNKA